MEIKKAASVTLGAEPNEQQLEKINALTKRTLKKEEVYVFSVRLLDNQIDRDYERFSDSAVKTLAEMFVGKTGILDHAWSSEKQVARIFETGVEYEKGAMYLRAEAYMLRGGENDDMIRQIEGGIKKEVSVGCAMGRSVCSICGQDYGCCEHRKGEEYGGQICAAVLCEPIDAYEFSFVAVPAQRQAGVLKAVERPVIGSEELEALKKDAQAGKAFREELTRRFQCAALTLELGLSEELLERIAKCLCTQDLRAAGNALAKKADELFPSVCQLQVGQNFAQDQNSAFLI